MAPSDIADRLAAAERQIDALCTVLQVTITIGDETLRRHAEDIATMLSGLAKSDTDPARAAVLREWVGILQRTGAA